MATTDPTPAPRARRHRNSDAEEIRHVPSRTDHAELRWLQRGNAPSTPLSEAWLDGYHVGDVTRGGTAKLHPPTRTLLVESNGRLVTVLQAAYTSYTDDHLVVCADCSLEFQPKPKDQRCPWCGQGGEGGGDSAEEDPNPSDPAETAPRDD